MENCFETVMDCLRREKEIFLEIEQLTESLLYAEPDEAARTVERRGERIEQAAALRAQAVSACGEQAALRAAVAMEQQDAADAQAKAVYEASLAVRAVWNRVQLSEQAVVQRLSMEKQALLDKIENLGQDNGQIAGRYFQSVRTGLSGGSQGILPKKYI